MQNSKCLPKKLQQKRLHDIMNNKEQMINAWSLLYDEMITTANSDDHKDFWENSDPFTKTINFNMDKPHFWKYSEDEILAELKEYISSTYRQHYSAGNDKIQTLDLIEACGDGEAFCRSNILKYASRYDKKGTARRDIIKILHYAVLLLHFSDKSAPPTETYNQ